MTLDPRLNAVRADLADERLRGTVAVQRYAQGRPARVVAGLAPVLHEPRSEATLGTFYHHGEAVQVFDTSEGYAWCQSQRDDYVGYAPAEMLKFGDPPAPTHFVATLGAYRYADADLRSAAIDFLPRHSPVVVVQSGFVSRGTAYVWLDCDGFMPAACLALKPPRSSDLAAAAARYLGCPYLWGGRSFLGLDCSGLVQEAFRDLGIAVRRDTDMQRETIGYAVDVANAADLRRGDLLYLPGHVLIFAGNGAVIHADGASMTVRREPLAKLMRARGLCFADFAVRRI